MMTKDPEQKKKISTQNGNNIVCMLKKFDYIGFNMRNQTHDPEINDEAGKKNPPNANVTIANICLTNKIFRTAAHKQVVMFD